MVLGACRSSDTHRLGPREARGSSGSGRRVTQQRSWLLSQCLGGGTSLGGEGWVPGGLEGGDIRMTEMVGDCFTFQKDSQGAFS